MKRDFILKRNMKKTAFVNRQNKKKRSSFLEALGFGLLLLSFPAYAAAPAAKGITQYSLEELMNVEVYSATKTARPLSKTATALFVIDQEDIRRSTAQSVPELLRMVPGLQVARTSANSWAISARGFNETLSNKLLVLIDGRSVYTPLHAGVYWDVQDLVLENIERIEVIRGPGGSLWGSNAVNGVINIITKHSAKTQGVLIKGGGGSERQEGALVVGQKAGKNLTYRTYGKYFNQQHSSGGHDAWHLWKVGMRADWEADENNSVEFHGNFYNGEEDLRSSQTLTTAPFTQTLSGDQELAGGHVMLKWDHLFSEHSSGSLKTYFDFTKRAQTIFREDRYTFDIEWDHRFLLGERHEVVWGIGYRMQGDDTRGSLTADFNPEDRITNLYQAFLQDTFTLIHDHLWFTGGVKLERNDFSGFEVQPTARLAWNPHPEHTFWAAFSRAVRIPSRLDHDLTLNAWLTPGTVLARLQGDTGRDAETLLSYEIGYRTQPHDRVSLDAAAFYNEYDHLLTVSTGPVFAENGYTVLPVFLNDGAKGETYGVELSILTELAEWWQFETAYTFLQMQLHAAANPLVAPEAPEGRSPHHQIYMQSRMTLPFNLELDTALRFVDRLPAQRVASYWQADVRLAWKAAENLEISVFGQNLLHRSQNEFNSSGTPAIDRAIFGQFILRFE